MKSNVKKNTSAKKTTKSSVKKPVKKTSKSVVKKTNSNTNKKALFLGIAFALILIAIIVFVVVKVCTKDEKEKGKKEKVEDKTPVVDIKKDDTTKSFVDNNGLVALEVSVMEEVKPVLLSNEVKETTKEEVVEVKDTTKPVVVGVSEGQVGSMFVIDAIDNSNVTATIDGQEYVLGTEYSVSGAHVLVVTDEAGNSTIINFVIPTIVNEDDSLNDVIDAAGNGDIIKLSVDLEEAIVTIAEEKQLTLDLNGKTLKLTKLNNSGNLTIDDSEGTGKIVSNNKIDNDGVIILENGNINISNTEDGYGIFCKNGGKAIINGGTITSTYSPLSGNNTTGTMEFEINGGTLTAKYGPAVYMPGPVSLTITDGTLNGGISLRMGTVNISGGIINAATTNLDSPAEFYGYSGNVWFADALYVFGGTYTAPAGYNNDLVINITGGTLNSENGEGSAVAIYNIGRVEQNMNITITEGATLTTTSTTRHAYDVLSLEDIGVLSPTSGYGEKLANITENVAY